MEFVMVPRNEEIGKLVDLCARGGLSFNELCKRVSAMGYKTTSLYEMVHAAESTLYKDSKSSRDESCKGNSGSPGQGRRR